MCKPIYLFYFEKREPKSVYLYSSWSINIGVVKYTRT